MKKTILLNTEPQDVTLVNVHTIVLSVNNDKKQGLYISQLPSEKRMQEINQYN